MGAATYALVALPACSDLSRTGAGNFHLCLEKPSTSSHKKIYRRLTGSSVIDLMDQERFWIFRSMLRPSRL